ncbi:MAG: FtsQ-type POTRA domain-containing protein [Acidimicrobiaceae bacterium]|nr:FtsQ-type POTRA domain-containing protein [Acidimicrobiaceae bacterium]
MTTPHPKFRERRAEVEDQTQRSRHRKLIVLAGLIALGLLGWAATQSALLDVDEVRIVGAERTSAAYLRNVAGVELGTPVLGLDTNTIEERLALLPEVAAVTVASNWGGLVTVEITERLPVARIESAEGTAVIGGDGLVLEIIERIPLGGGTGLSDAGLSDAGLSNTGLTNPDEVGDPVPLEPLPPEIDVLPEIAGAMFSTDRGRQIPDVLDDALRVAAVIPADISSVTDRIEITVDSLVLRVVGGGDIALGDARDLDAKFDAVRAFLAQVDLSCLDTLNVRAPSVPVIRRTPNC